MTTKKRAPRKAVAPEAEEAREPQQDQAVAEAAPEPPRCRRHDALAVYVSDGVATAPVAYCSRCLPSNITPVMVEGYRVRARAGQ